MADPVGYNIFLKPEDAISAFQRRGRLQPTVRWSEMMHEGHATAFTVAKMARLDLLNDVRQALDEEIANGGTFESFKAKVEPRLRAAGWAGTVRDASLTGTAEEVQIDLPRRLRTIYNVNVRMSLAAGHWARIQRQKDVFPYLRYRPSTSENKRLDHMRWYGVVRAVDDPWWQTHFPPNGWGCKCGFEQVSERRLAAMGWTVTPPDPAPPVPPAPNFFAADGNAYVVPDGIEAGFGYNPGTAHLRAIAQKAQTTLGEALDLGNDAAAERTLREIIANEAFDQFLAMPDGDFPIAILTIEQQAAIQAPSRMVVLPTNIYRKQLGEMPEISQGHPELTPADYRQLTDIIDRALVIAQDGNDRLIYFGSTGRLYKAVVRYDQGRAHPAVVSFHGSSTRKIKGEIKGKKVLIDRRPS
jgi:hypothetical protein